MPSISLGLLYFFHQTIGHDSQIQNRTLDKPYTCTPCCLPAYTSVFPRLRRHPRPSLAGKYCQWPTKLFYCACRRALRVANYG